jgi:PAS domain S-box-containing protein
MGLAANKPSKRVRGSLRDTSALTRTKPAFPKDYEAVFGITGKAMMIVEEDTTISLVNAEFERLSGYLKKEIEGKKSWTEFVAKNDRKRVKDYYCFRRTDSMLSPRCFEFGFIDGQGRAKDVISTIRLLPEMNKIMASLETVQREDKELGKERRTELVKANKALRADITRRKRVEKKLRESEERYRSLVDNIKHGINLIDADHNIIMVNAAQSKNFNKPVSELIGKKCFREFEKRNEICPHCPGGQAMATGQSAEVQTEGIRDDGSHFYVRIRAFPSFGPDGTVTGFIEYAENITGRKEAEEQLQQSQQELQTLMDASPIGICLANMQGNIQYNNRKFHELFGYTAQDIPNIAAWRSLAYPDPAYREQIPSLISLLTEAQKQGKETAPIEVTVTCRDGSIRHVMQAGAFASNHILVMYSDITERKRAEVELKRHRENLEELVKERTAELQVTNEQLQRDITERKRMEEQLRQSEERFRSLVETMRVGLSAVDANGVITYVNDQMCRMLGYSKEEIIGHPTTDFYAEESRKRQEEMFAKRRKGLKDPTPYEITWVTKDGWKVDTILTPTPGYSAGGEFNSSFAMFTDITERKRMEGQLRASEERFRMLADDAPFAITIMAPDRHFEYLNPMFTKIFGYTKEDVTDKGTWLAKAYPDEEYRNKVSSLWERDFAEGLKIGERYPRVFTVRCKDGQDKIIDFKTEDLRDGKQYLVYEDITERVKAEEALRQSEELYRTLIETTKVGVSAIDENGILTYANEKFCEIWGYAADEIMGRRVFDFLDEENLNILKEQLAKRKEGAREPYEIAWTRKDGQKVPTILAPTPIIDAEGRFRGSYGFMTDITERKRMEEQLRQSEERFRNLVETMSVGLSTIDAKGVITYVNDHLCTMLGYSMEEIIGHPTTDFYAEESRKRQEETFAKRRKGMKDPTPYEITWRRKDGRRVDTILTPTPGFSVSGEFTGSFAIITDITERKQMEERLQRYAAELERSNEEVKNFAYIVSHDLRVPLVNLKGYSAELRSALQVVGANFDAALPHLNEEKRSEVAMALHEDAPEALEFITNSVTRMDSFINAILTLSRLGRRDLKPEPLDMNALIKPIVDTLAHQIREHGITLTVGSLPQVAADRTAMEQIMGNILGNAVKYLDASRPGRIEVTAATNNGETIFSICDNGRGIAQEDMDKVFAPFRRAGKQDTPGEGMGMAYVQTLVRRLGGRIWCESELGKGTTFSFAIANPSEQGVYHA